MKNKKTLIILYVVLVIAIILIVGVTLAYFTDTASITGNINTGNLSIQVTDELTPITNWNPGDTNTINFTYVADGQKSAITRYKLKLSFEDENLIQNIENGETLLINISDLEGNNISLNKIEQGQYETNWVIEENVLSGQTEKDGVDSLTGSYKIGLASAAGNVYSNVDLKLTVDIEAVQARNTVLESNGNSKNLSKEQIEAIFEDEETVARTSTGELVKAK